MAHSKMSKSQWAHFAFYKGAFWKLKKYLEFYIRRAALNKSKQNCFSKNSDFLKAVETCMNKENGLLRKKITKPFALR